MEGGNVSEGKNTPLLTCVKDETRFALDFYFCKPFDLSAMCIYIYTVQCYTSITIYAEILIVLMFAWIADKETKGRLPFRANGTLSTGC